MGILYANTINEIEKIFLKKKNLVFWIILAVSSIIVPIGLTYFQNGLDLSIIRAGNYPIFILNTFSTVILPLLLFMTVSDLFTGEFTDKTIKTTLLRPISRFKIYLSKNLAILAYTIINLFTVFVLSLITSMFLNNDGKILESLLNGLLAYTVAIIPALGLAFFSAFLVQFFKNTTGALTTLILVYLGLKSVSLLSPTLSKILFTSYMDWHQLWLANTGVGLSQIFTLFMLIVSYIIIFFIAGFYLFDRKNI